MPARIVIYRDGVGDGQIEFVRNEEISVIKDVLRACYKEAPLPKFTYIIVSKRINTRFFQVCDFLLPHKKSFQVGVFKQNRRTQKLGVVF